MKSLLCYEGAVSSSCFHWHENKKLRASALYRIARKNAYASQLATHSFAQSDTLLTVYVYSTAAYRFMISSATFRPSMAADVIPPAYPAPSPHG